MTTEPTPQQWSRIFDPAAASPADRSNAEPDIAAMRCRLKEAVGACTDLAMDQAVLILENHRLRRLLADATKIENGEKFGPHQADHGPGTWSPQPDADGNLTLEEAIGQALGSASMCWVGGTGHLEFDSFQAAKVHVGIMAFLYDWADHIRKQANEATAAKMREKENW